MLTYNFFFLWRTTSSAGQIHVGPELLTQREELQRSGAGGAVAV